MFQDYHARSSCHNWTMAGRNPDAEKRPRIANTFNASKQSPDVLIVA